MKNFILRDRLSGFIITKKQIMMIISVVLTVVTLSIISSIAFASGSRKLPIYCVETEKKRIAISFDAAWGNDDTETLIKILKKYNVPATFFVVGAWVDKYPESVMQLSNAGHQIQNHSNTHPYLTNLPKTKIIDEIESCNAKIEALTGVTPTLLRPPYGDYDNIVIESAKQCGMNTIQWSVDSHDWMKNATAESIANRVISKVQNGSIILCHNDAEHTPEALPTILETLKKDGYEFVFISDLIYKDNYTIDHTGKQCKIK
ncbi:MAG: polysaccharide deacetylase family protein [Clostridia bacterium]|nr:polysaccharide deacetylase family protein [Clostridia bacterium]